MGSLSEEKSNLLHLVRWVSAVMVVLGHTLMVDRYIFGLAQIDEIYLYVASNHHSAVIVFFVLSGYVISFASKEYIGDGVNPVKTYLIDRWSRIYSVLVPGILLTLAVDQTIRQFFPAIYLNPSIFPQDYFELRLFSSLFSLQGTWGYRMQLGSNSALWSIGYEFTFYILFAVYIYFGKQFYRSIVFWLIAVLFLFIRGPLIMWYMLLWLMGVFAQYLEGRYNSKRGGGLLMGLLLVVFLFNHFLIREDIFNLPYFVNDFLFAIPVALMFLFDYRSIVPGSLKNFNIWLASFSYTLYVTHLPILFLSYCLLSLTKARVAVGPEWTSLLMTINCLIFAHFFSKVSEQRRSAYKAFAVKVLHFLKGWQHARAIR